MPLVGVFIKLFYQHLFTCEKFTSLILSGRTHLEYDVPSSTVLIPTHDLFFATCSDKTRRLIDLRSTILERYLTRAHTYTRNTKHEWTGPSDIGLTVDRTDLSAKGLPFEVGVIKRGVRIVRLTAVPYRE